MNRFALDTTDRSYGCFASLVAFLGCWFCLTFGFGFIVMGLFHNAAIPEPAWTDVAFNGASIYAMGLAGIFAGYTYVSVRGKRKPNDGRAWVAAISLYAVISLITLVAIIVVTNVQDHRAHPTEKTQSSPPWTVGFSIVVALIAARYAFDRNMASKGTDG